MVSNVPFKRFRVQLVCANTTRFDPLDARLGRPHRDRTSLWSVVGTCGFDLVVSDEKPDAKADRRGD